MLGRTVEFLAEGRGGGGYLTAGVASTAPSPLPSTLGAPSLHTETGSQDARPTHACPEEPSRARVPSPPHPGPWDRLGGRLGCSPHTPHPTRQEANVHSGPLSSGNLSPAERGQPRRDRGGWAPRGPWPCVHQHCPSVPQSLVEEQLSHKDKLYALSFGSTASALWPEPVEVNAST